MLTVLWICLGSVFAAGAAAVVFARRWKRANDSKDQAREQHLRKAESLAARVHYGALPARDLLMMLASENDGERTVAMTVFFCLPGAVMHKLAGGRSDENESRRTICEIC